MHCQACGFRNPAGMRFCGGCGRPLLESGGGDPIATAPAADAEPPAERRQLTMMFCDVVDSTVFSEQFDPEEWRQVVRAYQVACATAIERYDGYIAQYPGDGVVAYFGYPRAHEDDAQRAVRAALAAVQEMPQLNQRFRLPLTLAVRIAVHTGQVVVGEIGGGSRVEQQALGTVPNVAARLQTLAPENSVVVSSATERLIRGYFDIEPLGSYRLKGISRPMEVFLVRRETAAQGRLDAATVTSLSPLIGRRDEIDLICERWDAARDGNGTVVLISGEPGIGKSRVVRAVRDRVGEQPHGHVELRASPYFQSSALHPVIDALEAAIGIQSAEDATARLAKLQAAATAEGQEEMLPLLTALLSLPHPEGFPPLELTPEQQRQRTLQGIVGWWLGLARRRPLLFIVEDLHWIDPSTLELLEMLLRRVSSAPILVLATARPEFSPTWTDDVPTVRLGLNRLTRRQVGELARGVAGKSLPTEIRDQIAARADGIPLFAEELTKLVIESGLLRETPDHFEVASTLPALGIPVTLRDSLMARLDRLGTAKEVAQRGAVLGREFSERLLGATIPLGADTLRHELSRLVEAQLLRRRTGSPETIFRFNHALIQEEAYESLLFSTRRAYHGEVAAAIEAGFPEIVETQPEVVARHYTESGDSARAITFWQRASRRAVARSAYEEGISHLHRALEVVASLPEGRERAQLELGLQVGLATVLMVARGYASAETGAACERAFQLRSQVDESPILFEGLMMLWSFYTVRSEYAAARPLAEQCMRLAERLGTPSLLLWANLGVGQTLMFTGELVAGRRHLERAVSLYDPKQHRARRSSSTQDPGVMALASISHALWPLGYPDQALERGRAALTLAREIAHPHSVAYALSNLATTHIHRREIGAARAVAGELITLAREQGFSYYEAVGTLTMGLAVALSGNTSDGIALTEEGIAAVRGTQGQLLIGFHLTYLAAAYAQAGRSEEGWARWNEAAQIAERAGEHYYAPLLQQVKGDLLLGSAPLEAEACYREAIALARSREEKSSELLASLRLARLWREQDRIEDARQLVTEIYGWFTEGLDTAVLRVARRFLDELQMAEPARGS